jgi:hypothetical protein
MMLFSIPFAIATSGYDPTSPAEVFTGEQTYDATGAIQLWSAIERHEDPNTTLFSRGEFNSVTEWADNTAYAPWIGDCFGTGTPGGGSFLLHHGPRAEFAIGTPILFVPGAADNGSRGFITMATHMDILWRPVYALTFAHPHGDVFEQAEVVADAIARVKELTGAAQVDVVSHSKGGIAVAVYLSNHAGADWGDTAYESVGTKYRGDVRRSVFIATPFAGIDTAFRWTLGNTASLSADTAYAPSSWRTWYPYGVAAPAWQTDLGEQDFLPEDGDLFPGQRQLLARQSAELPGAMPWLGAYSLQTDWYTTYEGGYGFYTYSDGIDAAIEAGGSLIERLAEAGADPSVGIYVLAGENPLMPNGTEDLFVSWFGQEWTDIASSGVDVWASLMDELIGDGLVSVGIAEGEVHGLASGDLVLGEISGPSDGLVFVESATAADRLGARGATVAETYVANLSHLDLLYASPITGNLLIGEAEADPVENAWMAAVGARYVEADTIGWVERVLADDEPVDTGDPDPDDTGGPDEDDTGDVDTDPAGDDTGPAGDSGDAQDDTGGASDDEESCDGCASTGAGRPVGLGGALLALAALRRRRGR